MDTKELTYIAKNLTYMQRKSLRRLGKGKTINFSMYDDCTLRRFYTTEHYPKPPTHPTEIEWVDYAQELHAERPRLTPDGVKLLEILESL